MAVELDFETDRRGVTVTVTGQLSGPEILEATRRLCSADGGLLAYQIWDLTACDRLEMEPAELHQLLLADKAEERRNPDHLAAIVLGRSPARALQDDYLTFGRWVGVRMAIRGFDDLASARSWIEQALQARVAAADGAAEG